MIAIKRPSSSESIFDWRQFVYVYFSVCLLVWVLMYNGIVR